MSIQTDTLYMKSVFSIMNRILKVLERSMDDSEFDLDNFTAEKFGISDNKFARILKMLVDDGYIEGVKVIDRLLGDKGLSKDDIELIVPHQANKRIIETLAIKSQIPESKWFVNLDKYGNTSAASIPLALNEVVEDVLAARDVDQMDGKRILSVAFGGGLSYGGFLLKIRKK